jgi:DNA-binding transcriptional ArsR family regulator
MKKTETCFEALDNYAQRLKACGHPLRVKILLVIEEGESSCVKELWKCLKQSQPVISQHLAVLKELGIVASTTEKNRRIYKIVDPFVKDLIKLISKDEVLKDIAEALRSLPEKE